VCCSSV